MLLQLFWRSLLGRRIDGWGEMVGILSAVLFRVEPGPRDSRSQAAVENVAAKSLVSRTYAVNRGRLGAPPR